MVCLASSISLAPADGADDIYFVVVVQRDLRPALARHHLAVDRQGQRLASQLERVDQLVQRLLRRHRAGGAVQFDFDHACSRWILAPPWRNSMDFSSRPLAAKPR